MPCASVGRLVGPAAGADAAVHRGAALAAVDTWPDGTRAVPLLAAALEAAAKDDDLLLRSLVRQALLRVRAP